MNPKVDFFFSEESNWHKEFEKLRKIVLDCGLTEKLKWGQACYTFNENNIVLIHGATGKKRDIFKNEDG